MKQIYKTTLTILVILVTVISISLLALDVTNKQRMTQEILKNYPIEVWPYVDFDLAPNNFLSIAAILLIACCVTIAIINIEKHKLKIFRVLTLALLLSGFIFYVAPLGCRNSLVAPAYASSPGDAGDFEPDTTIDILFVGDEEFMAWYEQIAWVGDVWAPWLVKDLEFNILLGHGTFASTRDFYWNKLGHTLRVYGWQTWDSSDDQTCCYYMLQEGINEIGFNRGMNYSDENGDHNIDFAVFWTGQDMDIMGLGIPWWHAAIVKYQKGGWQSLVIPLEHELAHLWACQHCGNICLMNPTWTAGFFCGDCAAYMMQHWNDHARSPYYISDSALGTTNDPAGFHWYYYMTYTYDGGVGCIIENTEVAITAYPNPGASFIAYETNVNGALNLSYFYDNPYTFNVQLASVNINPHFHNPPIATDTMRVIQVNITDFAGNCYYVNKTEGIHFTIKYNILEPAINLSITAYIYDSGSRLVGGFTSWYFRTPTAGEAITGLGIYGWCFYANLGVGKLKIRLWTNRPECGGQPLSPEFTIPIYITT